MLMKCFHSSSRVPTGLSRVTRRTVPSRLAVAAILFLTASCLEITQTRAASVLPNHGTYFPEEPIIVTFSGGPGNPRDWVAVYPEGAEPGPVPSTVWRYVDGTTAGNVGLQEGTVNLSQGVPLAGNWLVYLLLNDGYEKAATNFFVVVEPGTPLVRVNQRLVETGQPIGLSFTNGPANPRDWIAIFRSDETPGGSPPTLKAYVGGAQEPGEGLANGTIQFASGLTTPGSYVAYFLVDDSNDALASESFTVVDASASIPRLLSVYPADGAGNLPPRLEFSAVITNGATEVVTGAVSLTLDDAPVTPTIVVTNGLVTVSYTNTALPAPGSTHRWVLVAPDNATPVHELRSETSVVIANYRNIVLPEPIYFNNFDEIPEGSLPSGWSQTSYTMPLSDADDFGDLGSVAFAKWTAVNADRFTGSFVTYSNPDNPDSWETDYQRILRSNPLNVLNGQIYDQPLASGRFLIGNSGYQNDAASQVLYLFTQDFNLSGKTNIHLAFKSLWEQNQDSFAAIEFSTDQGATWKPIAYFMDNVDIVTISNEVTGEVTIDAETTLNTEHGDAATYVDDDGNTIGGYYGAFMAAPVSAGLAPYIQGRVDDNPVESKRIELFSIPEADNQANVRFRFAHAGADSWYFGIDDFGLYSVGATTGEPPSLAISRDPAGVKLTWTGTLESAETIGGPWSPVTGVTSPATTPATGRAKFYRASN